jgi:hypothetical protein
VRLIRNLRLCESVGAIQDRICSGKKINQICTCRLGLTRRAFTRTPRAIQLSSLLSSPLLYKPKHTGQREKAEHSVPSPLSTNQTQAEAAASFSSHGTNREGAPPAPGAGRDLPPCSGSGVDRGPAGRVGARRRGGRRVGARRHRGAPRAAERRVHQLRRAAEGQRALLRPRRLLLQLPARRAGQPLHPRVLRHHALPRLISYSSCLVIS